MVLSSTARNRRVLTLQGDKLLIIYFRHFTNLLNFACKTLCPFFRLMTALFDQWCGATMMCGYSQEIMVVLSSTGSQI